MSDNLPIVPETRSEIAIPAPDEKILHRPVGLRVSTGEPKKPNAPGRPLDHFRFAAGELQQYAKYATKAAEVYGVEPVELEEIFFLSPTPPEVLDVRLMAWRQSAIRGRGLTNYAGIPDSSAFEQRAWAFDDEFEYRPKNAKEVRAELREAWNGESVWDRLNGRDDPRVKKIDINVEGSLRFCLPKVMGLGLDALYATKSRAIILGLYSSLWDHFRAFGTLMGYPFRLSVTGPHRTERYDKEERAYVGTTVYRVALDTPFTFSDVLAAIRDRQDAIAIPERLQLEARARVAGNALALPLPSEETRTRDEPLLVEKPADAVLNRIAVLEQEYGGDLTALLKGAYDVDSAEELSPEQAAVYEQTLRRLVDDRITDAEVVEDAPEFSFGDLVPDSAKAKK